MESSGPGGLGLSLGGVEFLSSSNSAGDRIVNTSSTVSGSRLQPHRLPSKVTSKHVIHGRFASHRGVDLSINVELLGIVLLGAGCSGWAGAGRRVDGVIGVWERLMADPIMGWAFAPRGSANSD